MARKVFTRRIFPVALGCSSAGDADQHDEEDHAAKRADHAGHNRDDEHRRSLNDLALRHPQSHASVLRCAQAPDDLRLLVPTTRAFAGASD